MKRIILSIFSVFITLGAAAETEQARPAMQQSETAADAETPSVTAESAAAPAAQTATPATAQTSENLQIAETFATPVPSPIAAEKQKRPKEQRFLPTRKRIDREINKLKFAYNADGTVATVKPFVSYFYRDNNCIGVRFGYRHMSGTLDNTYFDAGEGNDLSGQLPYIDLSSDNYSFGIFHRSYAGLDPKGRFGLFAEFELALSTGTSNFLYDPDRKEGGNPNRTYSDNTQVKLSFNPGAAVYIFPNVCATLSFGLGGIQYNSVTQKDADGNKVGSRKASNMRFRLNIAAINFGMTIHLWDKKKQ